MSSTPSSTDPISRSGRRLAFAGSLLAGGIAIGSLFSPVGLAGAQSDGVPVSSGVDDSTAPIDAAAPMADGRGGRRMAPDPAFLQELLGLSGDELRAARADGQTLAETAASQGVSESELVAALVGEATERLDQAVADGRIFADRAQTITADLEDRISTAVHRLPQDRPARGDGPDARPGRLLGSDVLADLGLDADELKAALEGGSTLAEAAAAQGVDEAELAAALTASAEEHLAAAVADGRLDADQAAKIEAGIAERVQDRLDGVRPDGPGPRGGGPFAGSEPTGN